MIKRSWLGKAVKAVAPTAALMSIPGQDTTLGKPIMGGAYMPYIGRLKSPSIVKHLPKLLRTGRLGASLGSVAKGGLYGLLSMTAMTVPIYAGAATTWLRRDRNDTRSFADHALESGQQVSRFGNWIDDKLTIKTPEGAGMGRSLATAAANLPYQLTASIVPSIGRGANWLVGKSITNNYEENLKVRRDHIRDVVLRERADKARRIEYSKSLNPQQKRMQLQALDRATNAGITNAVQKSIDRDIRLAKERGAKSWVIPEKYKQEYAQRHAKLAPQQSAMGWLKANKGLALGAAAGVAGAGYGAYKLYKWLKSRKKQKEHEQKRVL